MKNYQWSPVVTLLALSVVPLGNAHQDGCHRWHSCPSDTGLYVCGNFGYCAECPDNQFCKNRLRIGSIPLRFVSPVPGPKVGQFYSHILAVGGMAPYTAIIIAGSLPAGLALASGTGVISGVPTASGVFTFTVRVMDSDHPPSTVSQNFSITAIGPAPPPMLSLVPVLSVAPASIKLNHEMGTPPSPQVVRLASTGPDLDFKASSSVKWLSISPPSGSTPSNLQIALDPGLAPGIYVGTITFASTGASSSSVTLQVDVTVRPSFQAITNAASYLSSSVAPGEIISVFGAGIGPPTLTRYTLNGQGKISTQLENTRVLFDGIAAPLLFVSPSQISAIVPYEIGGKTKTQIQVEYNRVMSSIAEVSVASAAPGIFSSSGTGTGQAAALNQDSSINSPSNPTARGNVIVLFATGEGQTNPPGINGAIARDILPKPKLPVVVTIGGFQSEILYSGAAPGAAAGLLQINVRAPSEIEDSIDVPVQLVIGGFKSQVGATVSVRGGTIASVPH